ncbi:Dip2/Utp12 protein [Parelaphostrongylus tenuis]|uniref:Dip2/Utp12 protein n=1 Tax=Parelaphostrongylus tenuis TaxID=148309 RepID=A0AAD5R0B1_PARTN|nr:Dip2/Utp12 protein [Parelaphostrongylus tenuis]
MGVHSSMAIVVTSVDYQYHHRIMLLFLEEEMKCDLGIVHISEGKQITTVSSDKTAKFWTYEVVTEGTRKRLSFRESRILEVPDEALCCAVSPDEKFVIIGLLDNTAGVYFADTLKFFISLYGHSLPVTCVTVSPDSKLVVTGSADKSIKIWGLDFGDCHKSLHAHDDV